jgi:hypothetical protein
MIQKIKTFIANAKKRRFYSSCYDLMEITGESAFCMCVGKKNGRLKQEYCRHCPYYTPVKDNKGGNNDV